MAAFFIEKTLKKQYQLVRANQLIDAGGARWCAIGSDADYGERRGKG